MNKQWIAAVIGIVLVSGCRQVGNETPTGAAESKAVTKQPDQEQVMKEKIQAYALRLGEAKTAEKWDDALAILAEMKRALPPEMADELDYMAFGVLLNKKDIAGAEALARTISGRATDPQVLNDLAWELVTAPEIATRNLEVAQSIAAKANELAKGSNADVLETLARIAFMKGDHNQAISLESQAIAKESDKQAKKDMTEDLNSYKAGKLPAVEDN